MWKAVFASCLALGMGCCEAAPPPTPVADAVKEFCFKTGGRPNAVQKAVEAAGGEITLSNDTTREWSLTRWAKGRNITLGVSDLKSIAVAPDPSCGVVGYQSEDASIATLKSWMGFGGSASHSDNQDSYWFQFETDGTAIKELTFGPEFRKAAAEGRCWTLSIARFKSAAEPGNSGQTPDGQVQVSLSRCQPESLDQEVWQANYPVQYTRYNASSDTLTLVLMAAPVQFDGETPPAPHRSQIAPDVVMETDAQNLPVAYVVAHASRNTAAIGKLMLGLAVKPAPKP